MRSIIRWLVFTTFTVFGSVAAMAGHGKANIVETAAAAGQFETLIAAAKAAGLADALTGDGPLTVFAPTDDAFGALPAGTIANLLEPENKAQLAEILKLHVVAGRVGSKALADGASLDTLAGQQVSFSAAESGFTVNGARILTTDIDASNGIIHVIDRVILPQQLMSRAQANALIMGAIDRGVPMFNHGNTTGTVMTYSTAAQDLLDRADLTDSERRRLEYGLRAADHADGTRAGAWQLRYALDDVSASLSHGSQRRNRGTMSFH
ncbi:MAG: fasciclin domain-containing protein [Pseudomonadota bacterium]